MKRHFPIFNGPARQAGQPWFRIRNEDQDFAEIIIYEAVGRGWFEDDGIGAKEFQAALKEIPRSKEIRLRINSPGGNVHDGMAIFNLLRERRQSVTAIVDGVAASIASVIALAGRELVMPQNALFMIHDPAGLTMGNAEDMRKMAEVLDKHRDVIAQVYQAKTGKPLQKIENLMAEETWFTGVEALDFGFADRVTDEPAATASFDFRAFRRVPARLTTNPPPATGDLPQNIMKLRDRILALLALAGLTIAQDASDEELFNRVDALSASTANNPTAQAAYGDKLKAIQAEVNAARGSAAPPPPPPPAPPPVDGQPQGISSADAIHGQAQDILELRAQLAAERRRRIAAILEPLLAERPFANRDQWIQRAMTGDENQVLDELRAIPAQILGADPVRTLIGNAGNPLIERYNNLRAGAERRQFRLQNFGELQRVRREFAPRDVNTIAAGLIPDFLADAMVIVANNKLAMLRAFTTDFGIDVLRPRATVQVRKATTASAVQSNPTNFETGDTTLAAIAVTVNQVSKSFHITNAELNQGIRLDHLAGINADIVANGISDVLTAIMTVGNYGAALVVGAATAFDSADLPAIMAAAKNYKQKNLLLDGGHLAYLLPTSRESFQFGDRGAYGFDLLVAQNRWTGAVANACGFVCGPEAIAVASGMPADLPAGEFLSRGQVTLEGLGLTLQTSVWFSRASRTHWASYDVMFGAAAGDTTQAEVLVTA